jgi:hypothetical protein
MEQRQTGKTFIGSFQANLGDFKLVSDDCPNRHGN